MSAISICSNRKWEMIIFILIIIIPRHWKDIKISQMRYVLAEGAASSKKIN